MAEEEIAKHTKRLYKTWFNKELTIWHKISEFLIEIAIIVFAVTISIWFHNMSEHRHQQEDVKQFLEGLKSDLTSDIAEMNNDKKSFENQRTIFSYLASLKKNEIPNRDTLHKYSNWLNNSTALNPNDGRFQGFKSSGKIGTIENKDLQNDIMDLYEEAIPMLLASTTSYNNTKLKLFEFLVENGKRLTDSTDNGIALLNADQAYYLSRALSTPGQALERYDNCIQLMNKIINEIDREYGH
jgi:Family of unknown function (DUF6090)